MKPFAHIIADRARDPQRVVREAMTRLEKWANMSGSKTVTLEEVAWLGSVLYLGGVEAGKMIAEEDKPHAHVIENGVHTVVAEDSTRNIVDYAGGRRG